MFVCFWRAQYTSCMMRKLFFLAIGWTNLGNPWGGMKCGDCLIIPICNNNIIYCDNYFTGPTHRLIWSTTKQPKEVSTNAPTFFEASNLLAFLKTSCPFQINSHKFGSFCNCCPHWLSMQSPSFPLLQLTNEVIIAFSGICPKAIMDLQKVSIPY